MYILAIHWIAMYYACEGIIQKIPTKAYIYIVFTSHNLQLQRRQHALHTHIQYIVVYRLNDQTVSDENEKCIFGKKNCLEQVLIETFFGLEICLIKAKENLFRLTEY